jgi:hypothetical protein
MPIGSVVLTPGATYADVSGSVVDLSDMQLEAEHWTARVALEIAAADPVAPLLLVFVADASALAPHVGFAQRAARRSVGGYVMVDPVLPRPGVVSDWPDAPVTVIVTDGADEDTRSAALGARLRGWDVVDGDPASIITEIAQRA